MLIMKNLINNYFKKKCQQTRVKKSIIEYNR